MSLRGFELGSSRQLLSPKEQCDLEEIRAKIACILADCGFQEAAHACRRPRAAAAPAPASRAAAAPAPGAAQVDVEKIVREVMSQLRSSGGR
jgi:ribosomal protein L12E/L44/L45/RPP1/RPP2